MKKYLYWMVFILAIATARAISQDAAAPPKDTTQSPAISVPDSDQATPKTSAKTHHSAKSAQAKDRALNQALHDKFAADPAFADVKVKALKGVVTLNGKVDSKLESDRAQDT